MRVLIAAVGRQRQGPEAEMVGDYLGRASAAGRSMALGPFDLIEIDERRARGRSEQSAKLLEAAPAGAMRIALDERGKTMTSDDFAGLIARARDGGTPAAAFLLGGADGHDPALREAAERTLSFGSMVWPHMLARVMLAEQLYRAVSILAGAPYHRR